MACSARFVWSTTVAAILLVSSAGAQVPASTVAPPWEAPAVGALAPDFQLPGATRFGLVKTPVRLSDFRDKTVVLAFFAAARTKG